ncbi:hypothetical protein CK203_099396 [Vitis vinifera]|uniref:Uncharacterized protein n=1 Tax=Vitis vinifera TaxID=29760 RepID=A0A438CGD2_VITVI|nr:hypothetical protein CK203_099396 [Vitis vinifera]
MMSIKFNGFGSSKREIVLWQVASIVLIWIVWRERNAMIFEDKVRNSEYLWDSIFFLASLWAFYSKVFKGTPLNVMAQVELRGINNRAEFVRRVQEAVKKIWILRHPPQVGAWISIMPNLLLKPSKFTRGSPFMRKSANSLLDFMYGIQVNPSSTSLDKMLINFNVLCSTMMSWIVGNVSC